MGLRDKYAKKIEERDFRPIELNEENVQAIFNRCLADSNSTEILRLILFSKRMGYEEDSLPVNLDKKKIHDQEKISDTYLDNFSSFTTAKKLRLQMTFIQNILGKAGLIITDF